MQKQCIRDGRLKQPVLVDVTLEITAWNDTRAHRD